ncbi:MAG: hypothetical protein AAB859_01550 [Patescibacteria group bacterium]
MEKFYKIKGFASVPVIAAGVVLVAGLVGGLVYEFKDNLNLTSNNKESLLAQVADNADPVITVLQTQNLLFLAGGYYK